MNADPQPWVPVSGRIRESKLNGRTSRVPVFIAIRRFERQFLLEKYRDQQKNRISIKEQKNVLPTPILPSTPRLLGGTYFPPAVEPLVTGATNREK